MQPNMSHFLSLSMVSLIYITHFSQILIKSLVCIYPFACDKIAATSEQYQAASIIDPQECPVVGLYALRDAIGPPYITSRHKRNHNKGYHRHHRR